MKILIIFQFICVYLLFVSAYSARKDDAKAIRMDDSKAVGLDDTRSARLDDTKAIRIDDSKAISYIRMDDTKSVRSDNFKAIRMDDSRLAGLEDSKAIRVDDAAFIRMADSNSTASSGNATAVPVPPSAAPGGESGNILDKIEAVLLGMKKKQNSMKIEISDMKITLDAIQSTLITLTGKCAKPTCPPITNSESVRLIDRLGHRGKVGHLEVYVKGRWGTAEDDAYDRTRDQSNNNVAKVVCYQLGFGRSGRVFTDSEYDGGSTPKLIAALGCTGNENKVGECQIKWQPAGSEKEYVNLLGVGCD